MQPESHYVAPTAQKKVETQEPADAQWLRRAQAAYLASTTYVDTNLRKGWDDSIRAFNNQFPNDSKYNSAAYEKRSKLYRPKMRSIMRKNEAAAAAAFFSNMEVVSIQAIDQSSKDQLASADIMKELMQYRLTKSIPWYQIVLGGLQDAQATGIACAHIKWAYLEKKEVQEATATVTPLKLVSGSEEYPEQGELPAGAEPVMEAPNAAIMEARVKVEVKPIYDKPVIELIPVENLRIDPAADWTDPVNTSPYLIHLIPMYIMDIMERMENGEWKKLDEGVIRAAGDGKSDSTRSARQLNREDQYYPKGKDAIEYEIAWVQRHIHRRDGEDWEFYTLSDQYMLSEPRMLKDTVFHGKRPYVMGNCILETHKVYPSSLPQLGRGLTDEANEIVNQRMDNVKFVLNKKFFFKRGKEVDVAGLVRNVPGGAVAMDDPQGDVREITWPDVTQSAYEEQNRVDNDMNDLLGNFSAGQVMADHGIQGPARNMQILAQSSGTLVEYLLRTYVETFVQPILRQLVCLEQHYETDQVILAIAAKKAQLLQKYGKDNVTDDLLEQELTLTVNVGMGATDPNMKLQKFITAMNNYVQMMKSGVPGINMQEVGKEIFGHLGYQDGVRFFTNENPQVMALQQQIQQMQQKMQKQEAAMAGHTAKVAAAQDTNRTRLEIEKLRQENENLRTSVVHLRAIAEHDKRMAHELTVKRMGHAGQSVKQMGDALNATRNRE